MAGGATVVSLSANAQWIFASRVQGLRALFVFSPLYFFIYLLLRLEDIAVLVGAVTSFLAVAAVMYFTRHRLVQFHTKRWLAVLRAKDAL